MTLIAASNAPDSVKAKADVVCTGQNDEQTIKTIAQQNAYLELSEGHFYFAGMVFLPQGRVLKGRGRGITIIQRHPSYLGHLFDIQRQFDIGMRDFSIDDQLPEATTAAMDAHGIGFFDCEWITLENIAIENIFRVGFAITACENVTVRSCSASGARALPLKPQFYGGHGLTIWSPSPQQAQTKRAMNENIRIVDSDFEGNWRTGIFAMLANDLKISNCHFKNNAPKEAVDHGIEQGGQIGFGGGVTQATVSGNTLIGGWYTQGIEVDVMVADDRPLDPDPAKNIITQGVSIVGNTIKEQGFAGVTFWTPPGVPASQSRAFATVSDNVLLNNNQRGATFFAGVHVYDRVTDFGIKNNSITESMRGCPGIGVNYPSDRYSIIGNHVTITNAQVISLAAAIRDMGGALAKRETRPNIVQVNGRNL